MKYHLFMILLILLELLQFACSILPSTFDVSKAASGISVTKSYSSSDAYSLTGRNVANLNDVNGDGYDDVGISSKDSFYIIYGSASSTNVQLLDLNPASTGITINQSYVSDYLDIFSVITGIGDVNGDDYADVLIGFVWANYSQVIQPYYYIIYGSDSLPKTIDLNKFHPNQGVVLNTSSLTGANYTQEYYEFTLNVDDYDTFCVNESGKVIHNNYANASILIGLNNINYNNLLPGSAAGDINGDTYDDIIFLSLIEPNSYTTKITVIYGSPNLPSMIYTQSLTSTQGFTISGDLTVFPPAASTVYELYNQTHECLPSGNGTTAIHWHHWYYNITQWMFAIAVNTAGDVNKDGYDDLVIGSAFGHDYAGTTYVIYGSKTLTNTNLATLTTSQGYPIYGAGKRWNTYAGDSSGFSVAGNFDLNDDGYDDIMIGAPTANKNLGIVYVIFGSKTQLQYLRLANLELSQGIQIVTDAYSNFGQSVSAAGDMNNDGIDDILIGAPNDAALSGVVYLIYGNTHLLNIQVSNLVTSQGKAIYGVKNEDQSSCLTGIQVSGKGDFNKDGVPDAIMGAPYENFAGNLDAGNVYIVYGTDTETPVLFLKELTSVITYKTTFDSKIFAPTLVNIPGDIYNDGYLDIINGVYLLNQVYLLFGSKEGFQSIGVISDLQTFQGIMFQGNATYWPGFSVSGCGGDFNGDKLPDMLIGAPGRSSFNSFGPCSLVTESCSPDPQKIPNSEVYMVFGFPDPTVFQVNGTIYNLDNLIGDGLGVVIQGIDYSSTGFSVAGLGNFNDNEQDLTSIAIGAPLLKNSTGAVYVLLGKKNFTSTTIKLGTSEASKQTSIITFQGRYTRDYTGYSVASAGDFNGDTIPDLLIGVPGAETNFNGKVYVIYGGKWIYNTTTVHLAGVNSTQGFNVIGNDFDQIGVGIDGIGDINGDGYADICFSAPYSSSGPIVYVLFGTPSAPSNLDVTHLTGSVLGFTLYGSAGDYSGYSVSHAGDVNSDGFADFVIGAPGANNNAGVSYVVYGGKSLAGKNIALASLGTGGITIISDLPFYEFGMSVTGTTDDSDNIIVLVGNDPNYGDPGITYALMPNGLSLNDKTIAPTPRPTSIPTFRPTDIPTPLPTYYPTPIPTQQPTEAPTPPPFWDQNGPVILGIAVPAALGFVPVYFSKQICFYVLEHWSHTNTQRGLGQIMVYGTCKKIFLADFLEAAENKEKKKEMDEHIELLEKQKETAEDHADLNKVVLQRLNKLKNDVGDTGVIREDGGYVQNPMFREMEPRKSGTRRGALSARLKKHPLENDDDNNDNNNEGEGEGEEETVSSSSASTKQQVFKRNFDVEKTGSFRKSEIDIDSDDEGDVEKGTKSGNNNNNNNVVIKAVYSLQFDNHALNDFYNNQGRIASLHKLLELQYPPNHISDSDNSNNINYKSLVEGGNEMIVPNQPTKLLLENKELEPDMSFPSQSKDSQEAFSKPAFNEEISHLSDSIIDDCIMISYLWKNIIYPVFNSLAMIINTRFLRVDEESSTWMIMKIPLYFIHLSNLLIIDYNILNNTLILLIIYIIAELKEYFYPSLQSSSTIHNNNNYTHQTSKMVYRVSVLVIKLVSFQYLMNWRYYSQNIQQENCLLESAINTQDNDLICDSSHGHSDHYYPVIAFLVALIISFSPVLLHSFYTSAVSVSDGVFSSTDKAKYFTGFAIARVLSQYKSIILHIRHSIQNNYISMSVTFICTYLSLFSSNYPNSNSKIPLSSLNIFFPMMMNMIVFLSVIYYYYRLGDESIRGKDERYLTSLMSIIFCSSLRKIVRLLILSDSLSKIILSSIPELTKIHYFDSLIDSLDVYNHFNVLCSIYPGLGIGLLLVMISIYRFYW